VGYAVIAQSCFPGRLPRADGDVVASARLAVIGVSVAALGLGVAAFATALIGWRATRRRVTAPPLPSMRGSEEDLVRGRVAFLAFAGVLVSALFVLASVFSAIHLVVLRSCGG
jgi:hypothetical protein